MEDKKVIFKVNVYKFHPHKSMFCCFHDGDKRYNAYNENRFSYKIKLEYKANPLKYIYEVF